MGSVFMADQTHPVKRRVAVKVIKAGMDSARVLARFEAGRLADALPLYEETLELRKAKFGPGHPSTLLSMRNLAKAYLVDKQPEKALPLFNGYIAGKRGRAKPDEPTLAGLLAAVSLDLVKHRQYPAAETEPLHSRRLFRDEGPRSEDPTRRQDPPRRSHLPPG